MRSHLLFQAKHLAVGLSQTFLFAALPVNSSAMTRGNFADVLESLESRVAYVKLLADREKLTDSVQATVTLATKAKLCSKKFFTPEETVSLSEVLKKSSFSEAAKDELLQEVLRRSEGAIDKTRSAGRPKSVDTAKQSHQFFEQYLTEKDWDTLHFLCKMTVPDWRVGAATVVRCMLRCGWLKVQEDEWKFPLALLQLGASIDTWGSSGTALKETMLKIHEQQKQKLTPELLRAPLIEAFPMSPAELPEPWLSYSQSDGPLIDCPLEHTAELQRSLSWQPTRRSHWTCKVQQREGLGLKALTGELAQPVKQPKPVMKLQLSSQPKAPNAFNLHRPIGPTTTGDARQRLLELVGEASNHEAADILRMLERGSQQSSVQERSSVCVEEVDSPTQPLVPPAASESQCESPSLALALKKPAQRDATREEVATLSTPLRPVSGTISSLGSQSSGDVGSSESKKAAPAAAAPPKKLMAQLGDAMGLMGVGTGAKRAVGAEHEEEPEEAKEEEGSPAPARKKRRKTPETKATLKPKARAKAALKLKTKATLKPPAKLVAKNSEALRFPGTKPHTPVRYGASTVYLGKNQVWRIKPVEASRMCIHKSFKTKDAREVWKAVVKELKRLNP